MMMKKRQVSIVYEYTSMMGFNSKQLRVHGIEYCMAYMRTIYQDDNDATDASFLFKN